MFQTVDTCDVEWLYQWDNEAFFAEVGGGGQNLLKIAHLEGMHISQVTFFCKTLKAQSNQLNVKKTIAVMVATFAVAKRKPEKNSGLYRIRTLDLCDTGAAF